jgi:cellulase/cellobiase CelA1
VRDVIGRVVAAAALTLAGFAVSPAQAGPAISCEYKVDAAWNGGFMADLLFTNAGPAMDGWTVTMTFPSPTTLLSTWQAIAEQGGPTVMTAKNLSWNGSVRNGEMGTFGWTAIATDAARPAITVNGVAC